MKKMMVLQLTMATLGVFAAETAKVTFVGDVMCQGPMLDAYRTEKGFDFTPIFRDVRGLFETSDYVIGNLETPIAPDDKNLTNQRWEFCSPIEFAAAVKAAGIDFVFTANNHCLDRGPAGVPRTLAALDQVGLPHTGTFATPEAAATPTVVDVKGFKIGLLAYTYGSNAFSNRQYLDDSNRHLVNFFQQQELSEPGAREWMFGDKTKQSAKDYVAWEQRHCPDNFTLPVYERQAPHDAERAKIRADVARVKALRPDFTAVSMHTGGQYNPAATKYTKELASFLFGCGIDLISGTHEHVVHGGEFGGIATNRLATYSLGNFNSLNGVFINPKDKMADYSIAWHLYLTRDEKGMARVAKTTATVLKCVRDGGEARIRVVPAAELYIREQDLVRRAKLRADMMETMRRFCGKDFDRLGVALEYPVAEGGAPGDDTSGVVRGRESPSASPCVFTVDASLPAGNIVVDGIADDRVNLHQDLRDTEGGWFYWAFRVKGAAGRTLKFHFTGGHAVGSRGAAYSLDHGKSWRWTYDAKLDPRNPKTQEHASSQDFTWRFAKDQNEVWFSQTIPYAQSDWEAFIAAHEKDRGRLFETSVLCTSRKGRAVETARFGRLDGQAPFRLFFSSRHHCGESTATYVLEGVCASVFRDDALGAWLRANAEIRVVPFVDKDGVVDGDQGKNRRPHDHARDYNEDRAQIYPEVAAIMKMLTAWKPSAVIDLHCPWLRGDWNQKDNSNEYIYMVGLKDARFAACQRRLGELLEKCQTSGVGYAADDNYGFGRGWNKGTNYKQGSTVILWTTRAFPTIPVTTCIEIPFANSRFTTLEPPKFRAFGHDVATALRAYLTDCPTR